MSFVDDAMKQRVKCKFLFFELIILFVSIYVHQIYIAIKLKRIFNWHFAKCHAIDIKTMDGSRWHGRPVGVMVSYLRFLMNSKKLQTNNRISENILSVHQFNRPPVSSWTVNCFWHTYFGVSVGVKVLSIYSFLPSFAAGFCGLSYSARKEEAKDVLEGDNVILKCHFNDPRLLSDNVLYWMRTKHDEVDNVAIGDQALDANYR